MKLYLAKVVVRNRKAISKFDTCLTQFKFNSQNVIENVGAIYAIRMPSTSVYCNLPPYIFRAQTRTTLNVYMKNHPKFYVAWL